jgi:hypothetical protein
LSCTTLFFLSWWWENLAKKRNTSSIRVTNNIEGSFKCFYYHFCYSYNSQICSNHVVDDPHFSHIKKLKKSNKKPIAFVVQLLSYSFSATFKVF